MITCFQNCYMCYFCLLFCLWLSWENLSGNYIPLALIIILTKLDFPILVLIFWHFCAHSHKYAFILEFQMTFPLLKTHQINQFQRYFLLKLWHYWQLQTSIRKRMCLTTLLQFGICFCDLNLSTQILTFRSEMAAFKHQKWRALRAGHALKTDPPRNKRVCKSVHQKRSWWQKEEQNKEKVREKGPSADLILTFLLSFVLWSLFLLLGDGLRHFPVA